MPSRWHKANGNDCVRNPKKPANNLKYQFSLEDQLSKNFNLISQIRAQVKTRTGLKDR